MVKHELKNKFTYNIASYYQPSVVHLEGGYSKDGVKVVAHKKGAGAQGSQTEQWVVKEEEPGWFTFTSRTQPKNGPRYVLEARGNEVTIQTYDVNGCHEQQWTDEPAIMDTKWIYFRNRATDHYLHFNNDGHTLTCLKHMPKNDRLFWGFNLVEDGSDGDWLDSLYPKTIPHPAAVFGEFTKTQNTLEGIVDDLVSSDVVKSTLKDKFTYNIKSYYQPSVAHLDGGYSRDGIKVVGYKKGDAVKGSQNEQWIAKEEEPGWFTFTNRTQPHNGPRYVLEARGNVVTIQTYDANGSHAQHWADEPAIVGTKWKYLKNRASKRCLHFNNNAAPLTCLTHMSGNDRQYWGFNIVEEGTDGNWLDSLHPKSLGKTFAQPTSDNQIQLYGQPTAMLNTVAMGGIGHEKAYDDVLKLKMALCEAEIRHQNEQLAEKLRRLAALAPAGNTNAF